MSQQDFGTLIVQDHNPVLRVILNRPKLANAMNLVMVNEHMAVMEKVEQENYRVLIISGGNGNFCAGGDIKDMARVRNAPDRETVAQYNRGFGRLLTAFNEVKAAVVAVAEGAVLGGGFGLACVSDNGYKISYGIVNRHNV